MIYLDYAAHTPICEEALGEYIRVERNLVGNGLSSHGFGYAAKSVLDVATDGIAAMLGIKPEEVIFTSGASEANNLAIKGIAKNYKQKGMHILSTCLEHASVGGALQYLHGEGFEIELLKIGINGQIDLNNFRQALRKDTILVCVSVVDSELGAIQPIEKMLGVLSDFPNAHLHVDASQAVGKIKLPFISGRAGDATSLQDHFRISTMSFTPHKFYGPLGIGVLYKKKGVILEPLIHGSGINLFRAGTPSPSLAAACYAALSFSVNNIQENHAHVSGLRDYAARKIKSLPGVRMNSPSEASPYILNLSIKGKKAKETQEALNSMGIAVSTKSACQADSAPSRAVFAVTGDRQNALSSFRVSFGDKTTYDEINKLLECTTNICTS